MTGLRAWLDRTSDSFAPPTSTAASGPFRFLFWLIRSQPRRVLAGAVLGTCWTIGLTVPPWLLAHAVDDGLVGGHRSALIGWALALLAVGILNALLSVGRHRTMTKIRMDASFRSVRATVRQTALLGRTLPHRVDAGEIVTIGVSDVSVLAQALTVTGPGVGAVLAYAVVAVVLFTMSPLLAVVVLVGIALIALAVGPFLRRIERTAGTYRTHQAELTGRLVDILRGLGVLNGLGGKRRVGDRYLEESQRLVHHGYRVAGPAAAVATLGTGLPALFLAAVVWLSARLAAAGTISLGDLVAVYGYVAVLVVPVSAFIEGAGDLARARVAGRRITGLLRLDAAADGGDDHTAPRTGSGLLTDPLSGVRVRPGLLTAVVADRPADATRMIERLGGATHPGAANPDALLIADNDAALFAGTVADIVAGPAPPDRGRIRAALQVAVADDVVDALPGGIDATIAAGGRDLSGGQRQRIRLARAIYATPEALLAVDPTSAVDATTEAAMIDRLGTVRRGRTTVITTSSPLVLDRADEVIMLLAGQVAATGTHEELLHTSEHYRRLVSRSGEGIDDPEGDR